MNKTFTSTHKPIFTSLSPNVEEDDIKLIWQSAHWKEFAVVAELEKWFRENLGVKHAISFNSGRAAFLAILKALKLPERNEVLVSGFTCNALVNPIIWAELKPVFVDIRQDTLNLDLKDLQRKVTPQTTAVVVQHTFGMPEQIDEVRKICQQHNLILIEDCAHALGGRRHGKRLGTFGRAAFFSFGRDKIISSVYGGMAVTNDDLLAKHIKAYYDSLPQTASGPFRAWTFQQLLHPVLTCKVVMPLYRWPAVGRVVLLLLQKIGLLSKAVAEQEKVGQPPDYIPRKLPSALARLALHQLSKLSRFNNHRRKIASYYNLTLANLPGVTLPFPSPSRLYLRYPIMVDGVDTDELMAAAKEVKIFLDDGWRKTPIVPPDTNQTAMGYQEGTCPNAESVAQRIVNLPTHINITLDDATRIAEFLKSWLQTHSHWLK